MKRKTNKNCGHIFFCFFEWFWGDKNWREEEQEPEDEEWKENWCHQNWKEEEQEPEEEEWNENWKEQDLPEEKEWNELNDEQPEWFQEQGDRDWEDDLHIFGFHGSFQEAKQDASIRDQWLIISMQSQEEFNSDLLNLHTLSDRLSGDSKRECCVLVIFQ